MPITKTINFLPAVFQSDSNKRFLNATLDQLMTEPNLVPINGYVGRKFAPGFSGINTYIKEPDALRADYQLEPSIVVKNKVTGEVDFHTTYPEVLQKIDFYGGNISNQDNLWESDFYSYNPRINADAFINFSQYYWLPNGPESVNVFAGEADLTRTFNVYAENGLQVYNISGYNTAPNPDIVLARGGNYTFNVNQPGKPFWIQTNPGLSGLSPQTNLSSRQVLGVENNGTDVGTVTFFVPTPTAQDFFITMPIVQTVDLVSTISYANLQGKLLSDIKNNYKGIDGQVANLNGKYIVFPNYNVDPDWTSNSVTVPENERYGIWTIVLTPVGADYIINLVYYLPIPTNNKVLILSGISYGNTEWYTNSEDKLEQIPVITAPLNTLYYQDGSDANQVGIIRIVDPTSNVINVDEEIIGKTNYVSPNGVVFTNGLKINFDTSVIPASYQNKEYYIDGVGTRIRLIPVSDLVINQAQAKSDYNPNNNFVLYATANLNLAQDQLTITTTDFPDGVNVKVGVFPNTINTNYIVAQDLKLKYPYRPGLNDPGEHDNLTYSADVIGITLPGILINGVSNGASVPGLDGSKWNYDTTQVLINGQDSYGGYPLENGRYVYTNSKFITANAWGNVSGFTNGYLDPATNHSKLIGFAADGYPIYGPFGYSNPLNSSSSIIRMISSYESSNDGLFRPVAQTVTVTADVVNSNLITVSSTNGLNPGMRITVNSAGLESGSVWIINNGLKTAVGLPQFLGTASQIQLSSSVTLSAGATITFEFLAGAFIEDYSYVQDSGTLDQYNGRFCVTPEFPNGTYAYFTTQASDGTPIYPYIIGRAYYGSTNIDTNTSLSDPDYIIISRASRDLNPWTRRNRWFHKDIIELTSLYNNTPQVFDSNQRAKRPIIEFDADLQLINFGKTAKSPVDIFDTVYTNAFLSVEGKTSIFVDGIRLVQGMRVIFSADNDAGVRDKIWQVTFENVSGDPLANEVIHLIPVDDISDFNTVSVFNGVVNNGKSFYFLDKIWIEGQSKTGINQPPLFDVFDNEGVSFSDSVKYPVINSATQFNGTKIFSYKTGTGTADPILGFPLSYKNFNNIGDIQFDNNFDVESFSYGIDKVVYTKKIDSGLLYKNNTDGSITKLNVWTNVNTTTRQMQDIPFTYDGVDNSFKIDIIPEVATVKPNILIYVNFKEISINDYFAYNVPDGILIVIKKAKLQINDRVDILVYSKNISSLGFYQIPDNLNLNAQNRILGTPTLGELRNHIGSLSKNSLYFIGNYPGVSNLRDLYIENQSGTMLQQSAPVSFASMFLSDEKYNFASGLINAQQEYTRFKNKFINIASNSSQINPSDPIGAVDYIIKQINSVKDKTFPWYYSDMVPYGDNKNVITYNIFNPQQRNYELTTIFSNETLSNRSILIYLNGSQLLYGRDYEFLVTGPGVSIKNNITLAVGNILTIVEYQDTDGNWIPETPSKLGLYPKFTPAIYTDITYTNPQVMIRGHDGSLTPSFGDFRDNIVLELEKRIYNNIKVQFSDKLVSPYDSIPGKFRDTGYTISQYNNLLSRFYLQWASVNNLNYVENTTYQNDAAFSYNYSTALDVVDGQALPGSWRACFQYFYDTQRPNTAPWEMLGFSEEPDWWRSTYGPAPYTSGNKILWDDLEAGYIAAGSRVGIDTKFARPGLSNFIPVNENGQLLPPIGLLTNKYDSTQFNDNWNMGQFSPVETAWRNSSEYPFAVQYTSAIINPGKYFAYGITTSKYRYNVDLDQYLITGTNNRITQEDIDVNGYVNLSGDISRASGYLNWISDYQVTRGATDKTPLLNFVRDYSIQLSYRMAGFSGKNYLKILAEQNSPNSTNETIIVPDDNYNLTLHKSTPVFNSRYSAVIIEKTRNGFTISGYDNERPYFTIVPPAQTGEYQLVKSEKRTVNYYTEFTNFKINIPYGTELTTLQQVANFISGYERYLQLQGFKFDYYDETLAQIKNWQLSTKEFLFWTQQGWTNNSVIVLSPASNNLKLFNNTAVVDGINNSFYGTKVLNQNYKVLNTDNYTVARDNNTFVLSLTSTTDLIGYVDLNLVQYEHVLIFDNRTQFNDIIYDPIMGQRQYRLKLIGSKTGEWTGTLSALGFIYNQPGVAAWRQNKDYLQGDLVEYKSFYYTASKNLPGTTEFKFSDWLPVDKNKIKTGLLNNFARNAGIGETFYNVDKVNLESEFDRYALGLIGYRDRSYLNDLGLDDTSQVKFYQGFIKEKGTLNAINALGKVSFSGRPSDVTVSEDWAFRVGSYGSTGTNQFLELVLEEQYLLSNPTSLEVRSNNSVLFSSLYTDNQGLYKTSSVPWSSPFLINRTVDSDYSDDIQTAGYVSVDDIDFTLFDLTNVSTLNADISNITAGSTIWIAKDYQQNWNVYRVSDSECSVISLSNDLNTRVKINTNKSHGLVKNDTILLTGVDKFTGFYKVQNVTGLTSFIVEFTGDLRGFSTLNRTGQLYKLISMKVDSPLGITNLTPRLGWSVNNKVWVNSYNSAGDWAVYNKTDPWRLTTALQKGTLENNFQFGAAVNLATDDNFAVIGQPGYNGNVGAITNYVINFNGVLVEDVTLTSSANATVKMGSVIESGNTKVITGAPESSNGIGYVFVYNRENVGTLSDTQILSPISSNVGRFGTSIAISSDDKWLYISAPADDKVYIYGYDETVPQQGVVTLTPNGSTSSFILPYVPVSAETLYVQGSSVTYVPYRDYTLSSSTISFTLPPPAGTIVISQRPGYNLVGTIAGNAGSQFGYSLSATVDGSQIMIGAPLEDVTANIGGNITTYTDSGAVHLWNRSINNFIVQDNLTVTFNAVATVTQYTRVYVDNIEKFVGVDWYVSNSTLNLITFYNPPGQSKILTIETNVFHPIQTIVPAKPFTDQQFGYSLDICTNSCSLYIGAPYQSEVNLYNGAVYRFLNQGKVYGEIVGTKANATVNSGDSIRINSYAVQFTDTSLSSVVNAINNVNALGEPIGPKIPGVTASIENNKLKLVSDSEVTFNKLNVLPGVGTAIADLGLDIFPEVDIIYNNSTKSYDYFGKLVKINNNSDILVVASDIAATLQSTVFDNSKIYTPNPTTFDGELTVFSEPVDDSGAVWIYSYLPNNLSTIETPGIFTFIQQLTPTTTNDGLKTNDGFGSDISISKYELIVGSKNNKQLAFNGGRVYKFANPTNLLGWDVLRSQEPTVDINGIIKAYTYNALTQTVQYNLDYIDPAKGKILGLAEQELTYKIDYDPAIYNNASADDVSVNNNLYWTDQQVGQLWWDLSTVRYIDYEQGSIKYRTTNWGRVFPGSSIDVYEWVESLYPPSQYVANGGDGEPKYSGNGAYVTLTYVDPATNFATVKYYFWVKNKTTVSANQFGRTIPTTTVASYIESPKNSGVKYFAAVRNDSIALYNMVNEAVGRDIIFHLDYATLLNSNIIHNEYALLSDTNNKSADIPENIYNKLLDSASGIDGFGNPVPDPTLAVQNRYGIDIRPRQSMFIDRNEAIREMVLYVNSIFDLNVISQGYDLTRLSEGEPEPVPNSGAYDLVVTNLEELSYVNIAILPMGYKVLVQNDSSVDNLWTIYIKDGVIDEWQPNTRYLTNTIVRYNSITYTVNQTITTSATFNIDDYTYYQVQNEWNLNRVQSYATSEYWQYKDWYAQGFDRTVKPTYTIETSAQLNDLTLRSQDLVKINNNGQGKWFMIQVFPNTVITVGIQDGTIELKKNLYALEEFGLGFDADNFDTIRFDQNPGIETRQILQTLKDDIFIDQLDSKFLNLFFVFINYILDEQKYVDWLFKTSFINVLQKIQGLNQPAIYIKENQEFYKQYIEEVKPYKTTLREYVVDYQGYDNYNSYVSDFDVPPTYDSVLKTTRSPSGEFIQDARFLQQPEYSNWLSNYAYSIASIDIIDGGSDYALPPIITITGSRNGNDAVARALITDGVLTKIVLLYPGSDYVTTPVITITGGNGSGAIARANLVNGLVRNIKTTLVYDRYTYSTTIVDWKPDTTFTQGTIIDYNGVAYIVNQTFTSPTTFNSNVLVNLTVYPIDNINNANDRIQAYYQPELGQPGKDLSLLQSGIDYPGVKVQGPTFSDNGGFGGSGPEPPLEGISAADGFDATLFDPLEFDENGIPILSDAILDAKITSTFNDITLGTKPEDIIVDGGPFVYSYFTEWKANRYYDKGDLISYNDKVWYVVTPTTTGNVFSTANLTIYNVGPYASHAPEEMVPGRVYDTLDMTVTTIATDPTASYYTNWSAAGGIQLDYIQIIDPGSGYSPADIGVTIVGGGYFTQGQAQVILNSNGSATSFQVVNNGGGYDTTPQVVITGANTSPIIATAVMKLSVSPTGNAWPMMSYRIFKDMNDNFTYLREDGASTTTLAANLSLTDTTIQVTDASKLATPSTSGGQPGVVYINGERITYYFKDLATNTLGRIRRGTGGTGAKNHFVGNIVLDGSQNQIIPNSGDSVWYARSQGPGTINVNVYSSTLEGVGTTFTTLTPGTQIFAGVKDENAVESTLGNSSTSSTFTRQQLIGTINNVVSDTVAILEVTKRDPDVPEGNPVEWAYISANNTPYFVAANISNVTVRYTGNITANTSSNIITGSGTIFLAELNVGNDLYDNGGNIVGTISNVISNTSAYISSNSSVILTNERFTTYYTFESNVAYVQTNIWYNLGNSAQANATGVLGSTTATNGQGLFNANTLQVSFLKQGLQG